MGKLENERWELYARARVEGFGRGISARKAGYNSLTVRNTATSLEKNPKVIARMAELRDLTTAKPDADAIEAAVAEQEKAKQARRKRPTREQVLSDLQDVADEAREHKQFSARLKALELIGREVGMFVERTMQITSPLDGLTADQLLLLLRAVDEIDRPVIDVVAEPLPEPLPALSQEGVQAEKHPAVGQDH